MDWMQFCFFIFLTASLFFWNRSENKSDMLYMDIKLDEMRDLLSCIHDEVKDFHVRLCKLEGNNRENQ